MNIGMWLLIVAWGVEAAVSSIPWFMHAGLRVFDWMPNFGMFAVIGLHALGTLCPVMAAAGLWRRHGLIACLSLILLASAWLFWHIWTFTQVAWVLRDAPRLVLCVVTLGFAFVYALYHARHGVADPA
jgi:hypothetical protein